ncbi:hypothetical protein OsI_28143 [Oryza sativa Indica Group]|uniref:F-box domain-containing protein n=1 Tax=Oryza sativa subsp. indica TaxID=39946 RepID=A2YS44_ORYSI|nr:hypothetical protein OsI_28143 [Oryza sativa Indica Group]
MPSSSRRRRGHHGNRRRRRGSGSGAPEAEAARNWAELPAAAISAVLGGLDHVDILTGAGQVCRSWRRAARDDPGLWRRIDMRGHANANAKRGVTSTGWRRPPSSAARGDCDALV